MLVSTLLTESGPFADDRRLKDEAEVLFYPFTISNLIILSDLSYIAYHNHIILFNPSRLKRFT